MTTIRILLSTLALAAVGMAQNGPTLDAIVRQAGYTNFQVLKDGTVRVSTYIGNRPAFVDVVLSSSQRKIWMIVDLAQYARADAISFATYQQMMKDNRNWGPARFTLSECTQCAPASRYHLRGMMATDNRGVTAEIVARDLKYLIDFIEATKNEWSVPRGLRSAL